MTPLGEILAKRIRLAGPMTVAEFMAEAVNHPQHGYYKQGDVFGLSGDFITSPEISQMFGELIGAWCADCWDKMGRPRRVILVEIGPGRGTLMADLLRGTRPVAGFHQAIDLHLVETSPALRELQKAAVAKAAPALAPRWHHTFEDVPDGPLLQVSNEFFDALPIHQFEQRGGRWHERVVTLNESGDGFSFALRAPGAAFALAAPPLPAPEGTVLEVCPAAISVAGGIARRLVAFGGAALNVDYAIGAGGLGDSLQAVRRHGKHGVLEDPGLADLSAHVDFAGIARAAREAGAAVYGPVAQGELLERLGIHARAEALRKRGTAAQAADITAATERLLHLQQMGTLFKALAMTAPNLPAPAGFA
jgi:NADH dehydrogenase [ubiquinone] 1 alpha subcomplex assembly factor 7